eukprot:12928603-Prorocentrum_lima.AAC.1
MEPMVTCVDRFQLGRNRHFIMKNPEPSVLWNLPNTIELSGTSEATRGTLDMYVQRDPENVPRADLASSQCATINSDSIVHQHLESHPNS